MKFKITEKNADSIEFALKLAAAAAIGIAYTGVVIFHLKEMGKALDVYTDYLIQKYE